MVMVNAKRLYTMHLVLALALLALTACSNSKSYVLSKGNYQEVMAEARSQSKDHLQDRSLTTRPMSSTIFNPNLTQEECAEIVQVLLDMGAPPNIIDGQGNSALIWAAHNRNVETAKTLIRAGANASQVNRSGESPMSIAIGHGDTAMIEAFKSAGATMDVRNNKNQSPYFEVALAGDQNKVDQLFAIGIPVNVMGHSGLEAATQGGHYELVLHFLNHLGAHASQENALGETVATLAAEQGNLVILNVLVEHGSPIQAGRRTPLMAASAGGHSKVVAWLLQRGADPNHATSGQPMPIVYATVRGHKGVVQQLLSNGSHIPQHLTDDATLNALGHQTLAEVLGKRGRLEEGNKQRRLAASAYRAAADELEETAEQYDDEDFSELMKSVYMGMLVVVADVGQQRQAQMQARQISQVSALKSASQNHTGLAGYYAAYDPARIMRSMTSGSGAYPAPLGSSVHVETMSGSLSYSELAKRSRALAKEMREQAQAQEAAIRNKP